jgi:paired amphipathic helix protein Sin3a
MPSYLILLKSLFISCAALLTEIKEINEKKRKEDDVLIAIAAGNRRPIVPNMSFEYVDSKVHEDLYKIVKYSCGEVCSSSDQLDKVMKMWTTFLEPILGVQPRSHGSTDADLIKPKNGITKSSIATLGESNTTTDGVAAQQGHGDESKQQDQAPSGVVRLARLGKGVAADSQNGSHDADRTARRDDEASNIAPNGRVQAAAFITDEMSAVSTQNMPTERSAVQHNNIKANSEITPGLHFC